MANSTLSKLHEMLELKERLSRLEDKVFKSKRKTTTLTQQILLLEKLGMLKIFLNLDIPKVKKAKLLSVILNSDESNTKKTLESIQRKDSEHFNDFNYEFLVDTFNEVDLDSYAIEVNQSRRKKEFKSK